MPFPAFAKKRNFNRLDRDTSVFFLGLFSFVIFAALSFGCFTIIIPGFVPYALVPSDMTAGGLSPYGWITDVSALCLPLFCEIFILWFSAHTSLEMPLLFCVFSIRGIYFGSALAGLFLLADPAPHAAVLLFANVCISALYLMFSHVIRKDDSLAATDSALCAVMTAGAASLVLVGASLYAMRFL